jgi:hypothetical protein
MRSSAEHNPIAASIFSEASVSAEQEIPTAGAAMDGFFVMRD